MPYTQDNRLLAIDTPLGRDILLLHGLSGTEGISQLFTFNLTLLSENPSIPFANIVGQRVTITLKKPDAKDRYINGFVSRFAQAGSDTNFTYYQAEVMPWLWFLTRNADCRIFQNMTVPDIVKKVFRDRGFNDFSDRLQGHFSTREYCVQYRESDFNFVSRLMEQYGIFYFFEHTANTHSMILANSSAAHQPCPDQSTASWRAAGPGGLPEAADVITEWRIEQELRAGKHALNDYNFETPSSSLLASLETQTPIAGNTQHEIYDYPGEYVNISEAHEIANLRMEGQEAAVTIAHGAGTCRSFVPGHRFNLNAHYRSDMNRAYVLTSVQHSASIGDSYRSGDEATISYSNQFTCIPADTTFRAARLTPRPVVQGPQTAVVTGPSGSEIYTDKHSRVKVQFFWDRQGKKDENSSCWIRVSQPWAGKSWGGISIPRIGQEVIVDFLEGNPDRPIITGRVYNAEVMPPYQLPAQQVVSGLKSNSTPGGGGYNELSMNDTKGKEHVTIHAQYDMGTTVEHDDSQTVHNNRIIAVDGTHTETIKKDTTITVVEGKETNTVKQEILVASQTSHIYVTAATEIKLEVGASRFLMKSNGDIELKGVNIAVDGAQKVRTHGAEITSEADAQHQIKGAIVVSEGSATNTVKGGMVMLNP
jgi:type VI secretion system secreted protein VgrG